MGSSPKPGAPGPTGPTGSTTSPYNQAVNTYNTPYFGNVASAGQVYTNEWYRVRDGGVLYNGANQGVPMNFNGGWYTYGAIGASSFYSTSTRDVKRDIAPFSPSALAIINDTEIVSYVYESAPDNQPTIGFIADDTPEELSGPNHDRMDINKSIAIAMKAIQELNVKIENL